MAVVFVEAAPYAAGASVGDRLAGLAEGRVPAGLSAMSRDLVLDDCLAASNSIEGLGMRPETRDAALETCGKAAAAFLADAPGYAGAELVLAHVAVARGDEAAFNRHLTNARQHARIEQWQAQRRVRLAEQQLARLDDAGRAGHDADLRLLVRSERGIASIAQRYIGDAGFRDRIADIVETLPAADQARFVNSIRRQMPAVALTTDAAK